jgi:putative peptide-modifying radical SAM enzyme
LSCLNDHYMEYSIMTTNRCNLKCSYCINSERRRKDQEKSADPEKIINYIFNDIKKNNYHPVIITFYGGEPLIEGNVVNKIIEGTKTLNPMFNIFTNGTLVSLENLDILKKMSMISVSIDGSPEIHDKFRGKGCFRRIMDNYDLIRSKISGEVLAFVTITPKSSVYDSVMGLIGNFENIFWFLENSDNLNGSEDFIEKYKKDIEKLLDFWVENLRLGKVIKLIPFLGLYDILEKKHVYTGLPCGIGSNFQAISIDGSIYSCEDSYHNKIGSIEGETDMLKARENANFGICSGCEVKEICAGRCVIPHLNYPKEKIEFYCKCTKILINGYRKILPEVKYLVSRNIINNKMLLSRLTRFTDVIP